MHNFIYSIIILHHDTQHVSSIAVPIFRRTIVYLQHLVSSHSVCCHSVHRSRADLSWWLIQVYTMMHGQKTIKLWSQNFIITNTYCFLGLPCIKYGGITIIYQVAEKLWGFNTGSTLCFMFYALYTLSRPSKHRRPIEIISTHWKMTLHHTVQSVT
jgi:hypothetical protein